MKLRSLLLCAMTVAALAGPAAADVYKFKDDKGNTLYTDKPSTLPAERINVQSKKTDTVALQERQDAERKRMEEANKSTDASRQQRSDQQQATQLSATDKAERCSKARERYDTYMNSQKLYEQQANGERRYLTNEELDAARASSKASMDVMCK